MQLEYWGVNLGPLDITYVYEIDEIIIDSLFRFDNIEMHYYEGQICTYNI